MIRVFRVKTVYLKERALNVASVLLVNTHNIGFYGEIRKIHPKILTNTSEDLTSAIRKVHIAEEQRTASERASDHSWLLLRGDKWATSGKTMSSNMRIMHTFKFKPRMRSLIRVFIFHWCIL